MSNRRSILFLLLVILVLAFANVAIRHVRPDAGPLARRTLVARVGRPARLVLDRAGGGSVVLQRDGAWRIVAPYRGSVEEPVVKKLLDALIFTPVSEMIADSELLKLGRTRADFSLAEPVLRVTVADDAGADTISYGAPTPSADGVYAVRVTLENGTSGLAGMANFGAQPTFGLDKPVFEVNIFDFDGDLYDTTLTVEFGPRLRDICRFDSVEMLVAQLNADRDSARRLLQEND